MILPLNDDDLMSLLFLVMKKVTPEYVDGDIEDMSVNVLCCEIAIYIKFGRVVSPGTVNRLASIMKENMEDYRFMKVALALSMSFLLAGRFGDWNVVVDPNGQAESILIPTCFKIMGSAKGTVVNDLRWVAYRVVNVAAVTTSDDEDGISNHIIDALNSHEEEQVAGACLFITMIDKKFRQSDDDFDVQRVENILRSVQHGMVSVLREYPSNKIIVENALKILKSHDDEDEGGGNELLTAFANESDGLTVILNSLRQTATPKAYEEGMRILHFVLEAGTDEEYEDFNDQRRPFLDRDGISIILDAIRIVPHSKAMDVLMLCSAIRNKKSSVLDWVVQSIGMNSMIEGSLLLSVVAIRG